MSGKRWIILALGVALLAAPARAEGPTYKVEWETCAAADGYSPPAMVDGSVCYVVDCVKREQKLVVRVAGGLGIKGDVGVFGAKAHTMLVVTGEFPIGTSTTEAMRQLKLELANRIAEEQFRDDARKAARFEAEIQSFAPVAVRYDPGASEDIKKLLGENASRVARPTATSPVAPKVVRNDPEPQRSSAAPSLSRPASPPVAPRSPGRAPRLPRSSAPRVAPEPTEPTEPPTVEPTEPTEPPTEPAVVEPPIEEPPVIEPPVVEPPVVEPQIEEPPVIQPPIEEPPVIQPPVTDPPTEPPVVEPPIEPPVIEPPVEPPVVEPPVIEPPVIEPPVEPPTEPPVVEPPVIEPPDPPDPPVVESPDPPDDPPPAIDPDDPPSCESLFAEPPDFGDELPAADDDNDIRNWLQREAEALRQLLEKKKNVQQERIEKHLERLQEQLDRMEKQLDRLEDEIQSLRPQPPCPPCPPCPWIEPPCPPIEPPCWRPEPPVIHSGHGWVPERADASVVLPAVPDVGGRSGAPR